MICFSYNGFKTILEANHIRNDFPGSAFLFMLLVMANLEEMFPWNNYNSLFVFNVLFANLTYEINILISL